MKWNRLTVRGGTGRVGTVEDCLHFLLLIANGGIVSELVDGKSLAASLKDRELTTDEALQYGIQIASGLEYVHAQGIVHRDLKRRTCY